MLKLLLKTRITLKCDGLRPLSLMLEFMKCLGTRTQAAKVMRVRGYGSVGGRLGCLR
jgi:uncharacterized protein VirK/YbjX